MLALFAHWRRWHENPVRVQVPPVGEFDVWTKHRRVEGREAVHEVVADAHTDPLLQLHRRRARVDAEEVTAAGRRQR